MSDIEDLIPPPAVEPEPLPDLEELGHKDLVEHAEALGIPDAEDMVKEELKIHINGVQPQNQDSGDDPIWPPKVDEDE